MSILSEKLSGVILRECKTGDCIHSDEVTHSYGFENIAISNATHGWRKSDSLSDTGTKTDKVER